MYRAYHIVAEILALVSNLVSQIVTKLDEIISSKLLGSISVIVISSFLAVVLLEVSLEVEVLASEAFLALSSALEGLLSLTPASLTAIFISTASALALKAEIASFVSFAAVVAML